MALERLPLVLIAAALGLLSATLETARAVAADTAPSSPLEVLVLGSGGPAALGRAGSSYIVSLDGVPRILVDAGPGSFVRAGEAHVSLESLDVVLLTHLHVDHSAELAGFVKARAVSSGRPIRFDIYGPTGQTAQGDVPFFPSTSRFISLLFDANGAFAYLKEFSAPVTFKVTDLPGVGASATDQPRIVVDERGLKVSAIRGHHGDAPAVIYRIDYRGHSVAFSGDIDRKGLPALQRIAEHANLLVFNSVVLDPPGSPEVLYSLHSPPSAIGEAAADSHVGGLLLSHLSPAVEQNQSAVVSSIAKHYQGHVQFAADGMRLRP
ncbi:MAG: MBL fold metallo-hydrolase [Sinobacteraceae bacterium]|nr:MBL fold metallo-hydrolase [Nevskiaceae bacterium]